MNNSYNILKQFKKKFPMTIAWRIKTHARIIDKHLNQGEEILYIFAGQKNDSSINIFNTYAIAFTNKRIILATKRVLFGYFFKSLTPDMYNDLTVRKGLIFGSIVLDTVNERVVLSNIDPKALDEIETVISEYMMTVKKKYNSSNDK